MRKEEEAYLLYYFTESEDKETSKYKILHFFDQYGEFSFEQLKKVYDDLDFPPEQTEFSTKEDLVLFAETFLGFNSYEFIFLLSSEDFNIGLETSHNTQGLREIFKRYGSKVESGQKKTKGLFGRLF